MDIDQIIQDITSRDVARIRTAASEIISVSQDPAEIALLQEYRQLILDKTAGLNMGGVFAPNKRFVDYAIEIIDFHAIPGRCPCALYSDFAYECNDPNNEAEKKNISIGVIVTAENNRVDYCNSTCSKCGQRFKIYEREGQYTWWEWIKVD